MIQYIGLMVGFYILVRMIQIIAAPNEENITKIFAGINFLITLFFMLGIVTTWATTPKY